MIIITIYLFRGAIKTPEVLEVRSSEDQWLQHILAKFNNNTNHTFNDNRYINNNNIKIRRSNNTVIVIVVVITIIMIIIIVIINTTNIHKINTITIIECNNFNK